MAQPIAILILRGYANEFVVQLLVEILAGTYCRFSQFLVGVGVSLP
jgi:hypothetical protein